MDFRKLLQDRVVVLDGAMGTMLTQKGLPVGELPEVWNITHSEIVQEIHSEYIKAGADLIYANTFGANPRKFSHDKYSYEDVIKSGIDNAKLVANGKAYVALDIGSIGELIEPLGALPFEEAVEAFSKQIKCGVEAGCDVVVIETMTDLKEMRAAVIACKETCDKPIIATMSFEENMRTFTGCHVACMATTLTSLGVDAIGINCSLGAKQILPIAKELIKWTDLPIVIKANAGLPQADGTYKTDTPQTFYEIYKEFVEMGVSVIGGCCGTTPEYIEKLSTLKNKKLLEKKSVETQVVCSDSHCVLLNGVNVIGERINPTGKKLLKEALLNRDYDYILKQAIEQEEAGADILDVNAGVLGIDEAETLFELVQKIQSVTHLPLQIDSSSKEAIERALRVYNGRAIVNSVNGDDDVLDSILPIAKKYGAMVIGLTLDKNGIPKNAKQRIDIAKRIVKKAESFGIAKKDVIIDCLTLTVSAEQPQLNETLEAIKYVKNEMGLKTVLGVSNISFGLPARELINSTFLAMALYAGLNLPIINPNIKGLMDVIHSFNGLVGNDANFEKFIKVNASEDAKAQTTSDKKETKVMDVSTTILQGLKEETRKITLKLLKEKQPLEVINENLIPALDKVGLLYEKNKIFLPQLIQAAETAKVGFDEVKKVIANQKSEYVEKGKIILATVQGDVHDIGKNIVKVVLENYGYKIIDLGKNVPIQKVVDVARNENIKLIGLSALMTTTAENMRLTVKALKDNGIECKTFVGGAVITNEFAKSIGADFYAEDANKAVEIARKVFG